MSNTSNEKVLYTTKTADNQEITITNLRLIFPENDNNVSNLMSLLGKRQKTEKPIVKTYVMNHLSCLYCAKADRNKYIWLAIVGIPLLGIILSFESWFYILLVLAGPIIWYLTKPTYALHMIIGKSNAVYKSLDKNIIQKMFEAINNVIVNKT